MKLVMWRGADPNFGDELNNWIWPKVIPGVLDDSPTDFFVGIGTLLNHRLPAQHRVVFGSGAGYGDRPNLGKGRWSFYCVRGPLTAQALGLPSSLGVADPGILVRTLFDFESDGRARPVGFMPHKDSAGSGRWHDICDAADILYIDPRANVDDVLRLISGCRLLIAEAMHGAIVADALRVPWLAARIMPSLLNFKWHDWCQSMALDYQPIQIPGSTTEEALLIRYGRTRSQIAQMIRRLRVGFTRNVAQPHSAALPRSIESSMVRAVDTMVQERAVPVLAGCANFATRGDRQLELAARALRRAARLEGILSAEATLASKLDELETRLDLLRRDVASGRIGASAAFRVP